MPNARSWLPSVVREASATPKTLQAMATAVGHPPEPAGKIMLLKIPHAVVIGHQEIKLEL